MYEKQKCSESLSASHGITKGHRCLWCVYRAAQLSGPLWCLRCVLMCVSSRVNDVYCFICVTKLHGLSSVTYR